MVTLKSGMVARWDTFAGLVPVKVTSITGSSGAAGTSQRVKFKITKTVGAYKAGEHLEDWGHRVVPVAAVYKRKYSTSILPYTVETDRVGNPLRVARMDRKRKSARHRFA